MLNDGPLLELATTIPSNPILCSIISLIPFSAHKLISLFFILLEALVTSGVEGPLPEQNNFSPPPEPVDSIIGVLNPLSALPKVSATTVANG